MKRLMAFGMAIPAALAIAACGSSSSSSSGGSASSAPASGSSSKTVRVQQVSGVGKVLVDSSGMAVYSTPVEAGGKIVCDSGCNSFWKPVTVSGAKPTAAAGAGKIGEIKRPDGTTQATINGKPVYTFAQDSPGKINGNGFVDHFAGRTFKWDVVKASGTAASGSSSTAPASSTPAPAPSSGGSAYSY